MLLCRPATGVCTALCASRALRLQQTHDMRPGDWLPERMCRTIKRWSAAGAITGHHDRGWLPGTHSSAMQLQPASSTHPVSARPYPLVNGIP